MADDPCEATDLTWKIINYSMFQKVNGEAINSPMFSVGNPVHSIWYLKLYPNGASEGSENVICDLIRIKGSFRGRVEFTISIVTSDGGMKESVLSTNSRILLWDKYCRVSSSRYFKPREFTQDFLPCDTLTLKCHLKFESNPPQYESELRKLSEAISCLYDNKELSDLILYTSDKEFSLHQTIISQRAPEFLEDLRFQNGNSKNNRLKVDNMSTSALNALLRYLYSGCVDDLPSDTLLELNEIAEKYKFVELSEFICSLGSISTLCTQVKVIRKQMKWNIIDVAKSMKDEIHFKNHFNLDNFKFTVNARLTSYEHYKSHIEMGIRCISKLEKDIVLICQISLMLPGKKIRNFEEKTLQFLAAGNEEQNMLSRKDYYSNEDGNIQLFLNLALSDCQESSSVESISFTIPEQPSIFGMGLLSYDLTTLFESIQREIKWDVALLFGDKKIHANKIILSSWSPIFSKMFHHDMAEKNTDEVIIADIDHHTGRRLIRYMYSGIITQQSFLEDSRLYTAADKYQVSSLFRSCSEFLLSERSIENACEVLVLAHLHSDADLFESVLAYIKINQKEILCTSGWKLLSETDFRLASDVLEPSPASKQM